MKLKIIVFKSLMTQVYPFFPLLFIMFFGVLHWEHKEEKETERIPIRKEILPSQFGMMIPELRQHEFTTRKLLGLVKNLSKYQDTWSTYKSIAFLCH